MARISDHIEAKSDQLNADDLLAGPRVITITRVTVKPKGQEQPVSIFYEGDNGKPYKPNKSMMRVLTAIWGDNDENSYHGRQLALYRDPTVMFGKDELGGIKIGAASHIDEPWSGFLQVKKGKKAKHHVDVLRPPQQQQTQQREEPTIDGARNAIKGAADLPALEKVWKSRNMAAFQDQLVGDYDARKAALTPRDDSPQDPPRDHDDGGFDAP